MTDWKPTVPFPAEGLAECKFCGAKIGWTRDEDGDHPRPVEALGFCGVPMISGLPNMKTDVRGITIRVTGTGVMATGESRVRQANPLQSYAQLLSVFPRHNCGRTR